MKAVLISIQPKWCELIASGEKLVEVRKTKPKIETPFKCYIYCTQNGKNLIKDDISTTISFIAKNSGKVIGEFVCDRIHNIKLEEDFESGASSWECGYYAEEDCLSMEEFEAYLKKGFGFGWHISDLVIYDKPKELREFHSYNVSTYIDEELRLPMPTHEIKRPPQSWCYVEELR